MNGSMGEWNLGFDGIQLGVVMEFLVLILRFRRLADDSI